MTTYLVEFEDGRIGRTEGHDPVRIQAGDLGGVADAVFHVASGYLMSAFPEVVIDQREDETMPVGIVFAGFHTVARFTVTEENA